MPTPLVMLGSGDYATRLHVKGTRLLKTKGSQGNASASGDANPDPDQAPNHSGYHRPQDQFQRGKFSPTPNNKGRADFSPHESSPHSARESDSFNLTAPLHAAFAWLQLQSLALSDLAESAQRDATALKPTDSIRESDALTTPTRQPAFVRALRAAKAKLRAAQPAPGIAPHVAITPVPADFLDAPAPGIAPASETLTPKFAPFGVRASARMTPTPTPGPSVPTTPSQPLTLTSRREPDEPNPQTTRHPQPHPRNPLNPRLFADDAGTRRRTGRLQSDRLRARRSADQKGSPQTAGQQSPLFGSVA